MSNYGTRTEQESLTTVPKGAQGTAISYRGTSGTGRDRAVLTVPE